MGQSPGGWGVAVAWAEAGRPRGVGRRTQRIEIRVAVIANDDCFMRDVVRVSYGGWATRGRSPGVCRDPSRLGEQGGLCRGRLFTLRGHL